MTEVEVSHPGTTYQWLSSLPMAASAGAAVYGLYEGSKNYSCVTQYALGTMESSLKIAASTVAPVVRKLDKPIQAVDSYTLDKLVKLEEKVPALKYQPEEVKAYINESKEAIANRIADSHTAISTRIIESRDNITGHLTSGKEIVCSKISTGAEAITNSRAGVLVGEGKKVLTTRIYQGKEALSSTITSGRDVVYSGIQSGAESLSNTRVGSLVGSGVDSTLTATENLVEYLVPEIEDEKELLAKCGKGDVAAPDSQSPTDDAPAQDDEMEPLLEGDESKISRVERVCSLSRKVKLRMYHRSMQHLEGIQKNCKMTLEQLKQSVDLLKMAQAARDGVDKQYQTVTSALKDLEEQIKQLLSRKAKNTEMTWPPKDDEEDTKIEWLSPKPQGILQSSLDYSKQMSEKVFHTFQSVTVATTYLPSHLKGGAIHAYQYAQEMYSTLKPVKTPSDLPASALARISSILETQIGYVTQLGNYLASVMQKDPNPPVIENPPTSDSGEEDDHESSGSEAEEPENN